MLVTNEPPRSFNRSRKFKLQAAQELLRSFLHLNFMQPLYKTTIPDSIHTMSWAWAEVEVEADITALRSKVCTLSRRSCTRVLCGIPARPLHRGNRSRKAIMAHTKFTQHF